jgi:rare lipoprotein A
MIMKTCCRLIPCLALAGLAASAGCMSGGPRYTEVGAAPGQQETGLASYYGHQFHGRTTANGETYDETKLTAAHRTLPFGTRVRVTNLANGRKVTLRINDRGPFVDVRIIDVSWRAANDLDFVARGVVGVRVEILD